MRKHMLGVFFGCLTLSTLPANAIVIRDDRADQRYVELGTRYPEVGITMDATGATLIAPQWVLTAAHTVEGLSPFSGDRYVRFGTEKYAIDKIVLPKERRAYAVDSSADIALIHLARPVPGITPAQLYTKDDEVNQVVVIAGRGQFGVGSGGKFVSDGKLRAGTEQIDAAFGTSLAAVFHEPPNASDLEAASGGADSGDPAFLSGDGATHYIVGVSSFATGNAATKATNRRYQTIEAYARVSSWRAWIEATMAASPPSSVTMWPAFRRVSAVAMTPTMKDALHFFDDYNAEGNAALAEFYQTMAVPSKSGRSSTARAAAWDDDRAKTPRLNVVYCTQAPNGDVAVAAQSPNSNWTGFTFEFSSGKVSAITSGGIDAAPLRISP